MQSGEHVFRVHCSTQDRSSAVRVAMCRAFLQSDMIMQMHIMDMMMDFGVERRFAADEALYRKYKRVRHHRRQNKLSFLKELSYTHSLAKTYVQKCVW